MSRFKTKNSYKNATKRSQLFNVPCSTLPAHYAHCMIISSKIDPISASLSNILSFLADCFDDGLQYRSINVLRSALSSTHPKIDGYAVGQHPYVLNLMKGILNNRPPKPRYSYIYMGPVRQVTEHMKLMGSNSSLSLKQFRKR